MEKNYNKESKKQIFLFFILLSYKSKKYGSLFLNTSFFCSLIPDYCIPSDYSVKEELMIANCYVIKW